MRGATTRTTFIAGDPLRAVAALSVLTYHVAYFLVVVKHGWFDAEFGPVAGPALASLHVGLFVFFVLSGYLITAPFVRAFVAGQPLPSVGGYVRKRLLRIVPAFWFVFTCVLLCWGRMGSSTAGIAAVYGFAQNYANPKISLVIGQAWTLDVEIAFYLLVPVATLVLARACTRVGIRRRRHALFLALAVAATASIFLRALAPTGSGPAASAWLTSLPAMLFAFTPGIALATIETTRLPGRLRAGGSRLPALLLLAAGVTVLVAYAVRGQAVTPQFIDAEGALLAGVGTGLLVAAVLVLQWSTERCWRLLDNRVMNWIGTRSYSLYLVHQPVIVAIVFNSALAGWWEGARFALFLPIALGISLLFAAITYRYVERPCLRFRAAGPGRRRRGSRFATRLPASAPNSID